MERSTILESIKKFLDDPSFIVVIVIFSFILMVVTILPIKVQTMGTQAFWIFQIIPPLYWVAIATIAVTMFFMMRNLGSNRSIVLFVFSSILFIIGFRLVFPAIFATVPAYEPDAANYMNIVSTWAGQGINFGVQGNYQHNFPMCFLIGFFFVKMGLTVNDFFRIAPFIIYALEVVLLYFLVKEFVPENRKIAAVSTFLFAFSSLGYWDAVHYSPDLVGSMFFLLSLLLCVRFAKKGDWSIKALAPVLTCIFVLILTHHISTLYLIVTLMGMALSVWFFNPPQIKGKALSFFLLGIYTYTLWFIYGSLVYPSFFNIYAYFSGFESLTTLSQSAGLINNLIFAVYPAFIFLLFLFSFLRSIDVRKLSDLPSIVSKVKEARTKKSDNTMLVFSVGFVTVIALFLFGFVAPSTQTPRVLELLSIGMFPFASQTLIDLESTPSKKKRLLLLIIVTLVVLLAFYRYYSQIQRRVITA